MAKIVPIKELKNTAKISELCHVSEEPVYITKNGYGDMVIMSMDLYEKMMYEKKLHCEVAASEQEIEVGKTENAFAALNRLRKRQNLT